MGTRKRTHRTAEMFVMETSLRKAYASIALSALLAGCSNPASNPSPANPLPAAQARPNKYAGLNDLYVSDDERGQITLLKNGRYVPDGAITAGINGPFGVTLDTGGNLYVANREGGNITEYPPGSSEPSFIYSAGMTKPLAVTVDRQGNVFETDVPVYGGPDVVNEYAQQSDAVLHSCTVAGLYGVALDSAGDVFVDYNLSGQGGHIAEFKGGLGNCGPVELDAHVYHANGMVFDNNDNLIICDGVNRTVDVIKPPYSKVNRRLLHFGLPVFVSIDKANKHVFVTAQTNYWQYLYVLDYASGKKLRRLGPSHGGIDIPMEAVDGPNDVP